MDQAGDLAGIGRERHAELHARGEDQLDDRIGHHADGHEGLGRPGLGSSTEIVEDLPPAVETGRVERAGAAERRHGKAGTAPRGEDRPPAFEDERIVDGHGVGLLKTRKPTSLTNSKRREFAGRIRYSNNRREIYCLDIAPLLKGTGEPREVWKLDMIEKLKIQPCTTMIPTYDKLASPAGHKDFLYFSTGNSTDESYIKVKAPESPSLICIRKDNGKLIWSDNSPGKDLLFGQSCTPSVITVGKETQVIHPQADGWVRSFDAETGKLIWKFDVKPKGAEGDFREGLRGAVVSAPVFANGKVYFTLGHDAEACGSQAGRLCCIDPSKAGDISSELDKGRPNPNSGVIWEFGADAKDETDRMHCSVSSVAVCEGLVIAGDALGRLHCLDEKTGKHHWSFDTKESIRTPPLIADGKVYVSLSSGALSIFALSKVPKLIVNHEMNTAVDAPPVFANGVLFLLSTKTLHAIGTKK
jgi:outer membrane protein assembly factor BamB